MGGAPHLPLSPVELHDKEKEKKNETDADSLRYYMASENNLTHVTSSIASGTAINSERR